nr:MAG TPA: ParB protein [Caudoviricetes sp.]
MNIITKKINEIKPYKNNPRKNDMAVNGVANSICEFGFKVPIIIDKNNEIIAGHTRFKAAKKIGLTEIPCIIADDLNDDQVRAFRLADNKVGEKSEWDFDVLTEEIEKIINIDMSNFGFDLKLKEDFKTNIELKDGNYQIIVDCISEEDAEEKYNIITESGIECRVLTL